jgi:hypothetical protein
LNLIGCVLWVRAERASGRERLRRHRAADEKLRESMRLDPTQPAYRDNLRGNAVSCRVHFVGGAVAVAHLACAALPALLLGVILLRPARERMAVVALAALGAFGLTALLATSGRCALAVPLGRFGVPSAPQTPGERRLGRLELLGYGLLMLVPYAALVWVKGW